MKKITKQFNMTMYKMLSLLFTTALMGVFTVTTYAETCPNVNYANIQDVNTTFTTFRIEGVYPNNNGIRSVEIYSPQGVSEIVRISDFPHTITGLNEGASYDLEFTLLCDSGLYTTNESSNVFKRTITTKIRTIDSVDPDVDPVVSSTTFPTPVPPPAGILDCDGQYKWENPSGVAPGSAKVCPPLHIGSLKQAKGGQPKPDSMLHVYKWFTADNVLSFSNIKSNYLKTSTGVEAELCANKLGVIIFCSSKNKLPLTGKSNQVIRHNKDMWIATSRMLVEPNILGSVLAGFDFTKIEPNSTLSRNALFVNGNIQIKGINYSNTNSKNILMDKGDGETNWVTPDKAVGSLFTIVSRKNLPGGSGPQTAYCPPDYPVAISGGGICHGGSVEFRDGALWAGTAGDVGSQILESRTSGISFNKIIDDGIVIKRPEYKDSKIANGWVFQCSGSDPISVFAVCMKK